MFGTLTSIKLWLDRRYIRLNERRHTKNTNHKTAHTIIIFPTTASTTYYHIIQNHFVLTYRVYILILYLIYIDTTTRMPILLEHTEKIIIYSTIDGDQQEISYSDAEHWATVSQETKDKIHSILIIWVKHRDLDLWETKSKARLETVLRYHLNKKETPPTYSN